MACKKNHVRLTSKMNQIPTDQGGRGRHKCAACAYEEGYNAGYKLDEHVDIASVLDGLEESQASDLQMERSATRYA